VQIVAGILCILLSVALLMAPIFVLFLAELSILNAAFLALGFTVLFAIALALVTKGDMEKVSVGTSA
jgi:hypothetical protein